MKNRFDVDQTVIRHQTIRRAIAAALLVIGTGWLLEYFHPAPVTIQMERSEPAVPFGPFVVPEPMPKDNTPGYSF